MRLIIRIILVLCVTLGYGQTYWGAELRTVENFQYGRFETSLKPSQGDGFLSSFFTYNDSFPSTDWCEIDFEILGRWPDNVDVNVIDEFGSHLRQHPLDFNPHLDFHRYAFEWTPDYVAWFIDGEEFYRQDGEHISHLEQPGKLMMNIWTPAYADWVGTMDPRILPRYAHYDWASYAAYTPGSGSTGSNNDFTPVWRDEFDAFVDTLWEKSDGHSWNGNLATLQAENIVYEDGKMILCLTEPDMGGVQPDGDPPVGLWARAITLDSVIVRYSEWLNPATANDPATFVIPGNTVQSATLLEDQITVSLKLAQDLGASGNVFALGLTDIAEPPNVQLGSLVSIDMPEPLALPIRIDIGGPGRQGFLPDQWWSTDVEYGHEGGNYQTSDFRDLEGTDLDSVLATSLNRWSRYNVRLQPGVFDIQLHFAEHYYTGAGERTFELYVEDSLVIPELDVFEEAGSMASFTYTIADLEITDGQLDILGAAIEYGRTYVYAGPLLNGLEIDGEFMVSVDTPIAPESFSVDAAYPNPFNASTHIRFKLPRSSRVKAILYSVKGEQLRQLSNREFTSGTHTLDIDASGLSSGLYLLRLTAGDQVATQKLLYLK